MNVYIVYAMFPEGEKFALAAYVKETKASAHVDRCKRPNDAGKSPAHVLGLSDVYYEPLPVEEA